MHEPGEIIVRLMCASVCLRLVSLRKQIIKELMSFDISGKGPGFKPFILLYDIKSIKSSDAVESSFHCTMSVSLYILKEANATSSL